MEREQLILKWLKNELNHEELKAFKKLEDYNDLIQLNNALETFKSEEYNTAEALDLVLNTIKSKKTSTSWIKNIIRVAAVLVISFGPYYYTTTLDTKYSTDVAQKSLIELPDQSIVNLNAQSTLIFNKSDWKKEREVNLSGEAFFKVSKGSSFLVKTKTGVVTVYGTEFNVKQREQFFEIICYEGLVGVTYNSQETKLKPGDSFLILDGKFIAKEKENNLEPSWLNNESSFKSLPYKQVIAEFERQYGVNTTLINVDKNQLFTGSFTHNNLELALKSITLPLHITYSKTNDAIILKGE
ncbi:FecR family protein [Aestuariibaculum suncheonense]|uniref:FecR family protein n=1 Tax=Aestuariibaculum suncheonense TaxID=1028745 RepID=A0A8J6ULP1_9FLAO|nr:FecR family protein [Aestuariibaculum suncheonense]MBD0836446.1 FecR family protein [Aestuariibaculum suncheonense]